MKTTAICLDVLNRIGAKAARFSKATLFGCLVVLIVGMLPATVSAQTTQWVQQMGTGGISSGVSSDALGNSYATGTVSNPALFDNVTIACHASDVFVAKYNSSGALLWAKVAGGELLDQGNAIATDANGNSYVAGAIQTNGIYPTVSFDNITLTGHGDYDWFIAKYDVNGNVVWAKNAGSNLGDIARGIVVDVLGNVYVCGLFSGTMTVDGSTVTSSGLFDVFLAKYDGNGNLIWIRRAGGTGSDIAHGITVDSFGNVAIVGEFQNTATFGSNSVTAAGLGDAFIAKYDSSGTNLWVRSGGSSTSFATDAAKSIGSDGSNSFVVTGDYTGSATFGGLSVPNAGSSGTDIFVAKYDSNGVIQWLHHAGGPHADKGYSIGVDQAGNNWVSGFAGSGTGIVFDTISLPPRGNEYIFLAKYNAAGIVQYVKQYAAGSGEHVHVTNDGCLYFSGGASKAAGNEFDNVSLVYVDRGGFVGKFCEPAVPTPTPGVSISGSVSYCSSPIPDPATGITITLTGSASLLTTTDGSGNYSFASLPAGGNYVATPSKPALVPGSSGINTLDVVSTQRHFLRIGIPLAGCPLIAADINGDGGINTLDIVAIQRFFLGLTTGTANVGKYQFSPTNRTYSGLVNAQLGQNYDVLILGDVVSSFARSSNSLEEPISTSDRYVVVTEVALPEITSTSRSPQLAAVTASNMDGQNDVVGFQGDFTFDERVVTFQIPPVQKAGMTAGNWNVSGNVMPGPGPIRTVRISGYSTDFVPLAGSGKLFELRVDKVRSGTRGGQLIWAAPPDNFIFITSDLKTIEPGKAARERFGECGIAIVSR